MGTAKQAQLEQWEAERHAEMVEWFKDKYGRAPRDGELDEAEFELDEAFEHAMSKDD